MVSTVYSFGIRGIRGYQTNVEAYVVRGIPEFNIIGLGDASVKESKRRVIAALKNQGYEIPSGRITINLAPSDVRKEGTSFDLAIAVSLLCFSGVFQTEQIKPYAFIGELSLDGSVRGIRGILAMILEGRAQGIRDFIVPKENCKEGALISDVRVYGIENLRQIHGVLTRELSCEICTLPSVQGNQPVSSLCFSQVYGQMNVKRALEVAAVGGHHVLMLGMAGVGKTMLAKRFPTILPPLSQEEIFEIASIRSACGMNLPNDILNGMRPFREVRSDVTKAGLIGGRIPIMPGEISLAHRGVLFWDEMAESDRVVLDALRIPLESKEVRLSRAGMAEIYPAQFQFIGATNPCRCGRKLEGNGSCKCTPGEIQRYFAKISRPLLERMDIQIPVRSVPVNGVSCSILNAEQETSQMIRSRVIQLRNIQKERFKQERISTNSEITRNMLERYCPVSATGKKLLYASIKELGLSMRSYEKTLQIARTVADMNHREILEEEDIAEAVTYRQSDQIYRDSVGLEGCI